MSEALGGAVAVPGAPPLLELRDVGKDYGSVIALDGITTTVRAGEVTCVLGDNGAGKSTLIKILSGVHRPDRGEVLLDGQPVSFGAPRDALDAGIATVYQDLAMIPLMAIWRNFFLGAEPTRGGARSGASTRPRRGDHPPRAGRDGHRPARPRPARGHPVRR
ncbi:ATP-binding cassette domain-containing protein [Blastococcus brunescens]|uniref:ATP-binding cassette domain-containing protein n=1 Tax=Blastococcus brunescens TaxID=1564165 RepID=A0ABZ1AXS1_9ACTN|nr:ATP-binding cassette domain-containing protein [Blastococcus sp. BMG 8361]WRL63305.1 ATP-binding cassette domain-containing protein [Blastococcus sp. BMG 8361]